MFHNHAKNSKKTCKQVPTWVYKFEIAINENEMTCRLPLSI